MVKKLLPGLASNIATVSALYLLLIRPWKIRWGATDEEVTRAMPGDDEVKHPLMVGTRAVTIQARPDDIWPWLVQIGTGRAGWYSYDWIENLMGLEIRGARRIIPEFSILKLATRSHWVLGSASR